MPDLATQLALSEQIQRRAFVTVPELPLGQVSMPTAFRQTVTDIVRAPYPIFWGLKKT